jgi:hypothetical protein
MRLANMIVAYATLALMVPGISAAFSPNVTMTCRPLNNFWKYTALRHCFVIVWHWSEDPVPTKTIDAQYSTPGWSRSPTKKTNNPTFTQDRAAFFNPGGGNTNYDISVPNGMTAEDFADAIKHSADDIYCRFYSPIGPNSNTVAAAIVSNAGGAPPHVPYALGARVSGCRRRSVN